jgi:hypothetical protein
VITDPDTRETGRLRCCRIWPPHPHQPRPDLATRPAPGCRISSPRACQRLCPVHSSLAEWTLYSRSSIRRESRRRAAYATTLPGSCPSRSRCPGDKPFAESY